MAYSTRFYVSIQNRTAKDKADIESYVHPSPQLEVYPSPVVYQGTLYIVKSSVWWVALIFVMEKVVYRQMDSIVSEKKSTHRSQSRHLEAAVNYYMMVGYEYQSEKAKATG